MTSDQRREQIVGAAIAVFGARGYVGTTTDEVARTAEVSQPYVVRLFGSKEKLFLAAMNHAQDELITTFRTAIQGEPAVADHNGDEMVARMGDAYVELLRVRGLHQFLSQLFLLGGHPVIGPPARACFATIWRMLREEAGLDRDRAFSFLSIGMLINTLLGLRITQRYGEDSGMTELLDSCFPDSIDAVLDSAPRADEPW